jgi:hypothetical protein
MADHPETPQVNEHAELKIILISIYPKQFMVVIWHPTFHLRPFLGHQMVLEL